MWTPVDLVQACQPLRSDGPAPPSSEPGAGRTRPSQEKCPAPQGPFGHGAMPKPRSRLDLHRPAAGHGRFLVPHRPHSTHGGLGAVELDVRMPPKRSFHCGIQFADPFQKRKDVYVEECDNGLAVAQARPAPPERAASGYRPGIKQLPCSLHSPCKMSWEMPLTSTHAYELAVELSCVGEKRLQLRPGVQCPQHCPPETETRDHGHRRLLQKGWSYEES